MALVAYGDSDSSDIEEDETSDIVEKIKVETESSGVSERKNQEETEIAPYTHASVTTESDNLFTRLPQPARTRAAVVEDDDEFLHKKETVSKPKAKITVPSLSDFKDVESSAPNAKPKVTNGKKSGLLSMLPQPKNAVLVSTTTKTFVPHVLTRKPPTGVKKKEPLPSPSKKIKQDLKSLITQYSDDSDDDQVENDFFSINKIDDPIPVADVPLDLDKPQVVRITSTEANKKKIHNIQSYFKQDNFEESGVSHTNVVNGVDDPTGYSHHEVSSSSYDNNYQVEATNSNEVVLDDEAILKLCGARGKRKREEIQIVDVNQQEVLADARDWLMKGLMDDTTKRVSASKRRGDEPTSQQRRKHQITYLAHQAKANEAELQNQWANNRVSKRQTQSKYGF